MTQRLNDSRFRDDILKAHNECRDKHDTDPLEWSNELSTQAQKWAENLANRDEMEHASREVRNGAGENLACAGGRELSGRDATMMWYDEIEDYNFNGKPAYSPQCGHFTQVVWVGSTQVGAGIAKSKSGMTYVVARYKPAGNITNRFEGNVKPVGRSSKKKSTPAQKKTTENKESHSTVEFKPVEIKVNINDNDTNDNNKKNRKNNENNNSVVITNKNNHHQKTMEQETVTVTINKTNNKNTSTSDRLRAHRKMSLIPMIGLICGFIAFVLEIVSIATNYWRESEAFNEGLWESCNQNLCKTLSYDNVPAWFKATRALCLLAIISTGIGLFLGVLSFLTNKIRCYFVALPFLMACLFQFIANVIYTAEITKMTSNVDVSFGWSYVLAWIAMVLIGFAGALFIRDK